jgi:plasmid stabilization system protein ParE
VKLRWSRRALDDLRGFHEWLSTLERAKPDQTIGRIREAAARLERRGDVGRPSPVAGLRELSVRSAPYVIVYRIVDDTAEILAVYHTAQRRQ